MPGTTAWENMPGSVWGGKGQRKTPSTLALASVQLKSEIWELTSVVPEWLSH